MAGYAPAGGQPSGTVPQVPAPVLVSFDGSAPQSRLTVLVRIFMVIPQVVVVALLSIGAWTVTIIGWFAALFTGRLPGFAADFLTGFLRWQTRVFAYAVLLTDVYPPFTLDEADYPVRVATTPGRLNRLAVLFRFFLLIPCCIVQSVLSYGAFTIFQLISWLIVLIAGRMPDPVHEALAAAVRYQARITGFALMLTSAYPGGLFGDTPGRHRPAESGSQPGYGIPQGYSCPQEYGAQPGYSAPRESGAQPGYGGQLGYGDQPGYGAGPGYGPPWEHASRAGYGAPWERASQPGYGAPWERASQPGYEGAAGYGAQPGYGGQVAAAGYGAPVAAGPSRSLVLSAPARKLVAGFLVLGVLLAVGNGAFEAATVGHGVSAVAAASQVQADSVPVSTAVSSYPADVRKCQGQLACVTRLDRNVATTFGTFAGQLRAIPMPSRAVAATSALATSATSTAAIFARLGAATAAAQYISLAGKANLNTSLNQVNQDYENLGKALNS